MRQLVVCCDGTWQTATQRFPTNVYRLKNALAPTAADGTEQMSHYFGGVGAAGSIWSRATGGVAGVGLSGNVKEAYYWLTTTYRDGDQIAVFGFSRGAYTARSLAGMIGSCGLLDTTGASEEQTWRQIEQVYRRKYRAGDTAKPSWRDGLRFRYDPGDEAEIPVRFIGVWDTVGSLGVPDHLGLVNLLDSPRRYEFHDVTLNPHLPHGRHAVALDEFRGPFCPTLWSEPAPGQDVKQVWFPGDHGDVGGGHPETGLSDGALMWMIDEASAAVGLAFNKANVGQIRPNPRDVLHSDSRSAAGPIGPLVEALFQPRPRAVPLLDPQRRSSSVHSSAYERQQDLLLPGGPYRPTRRLAVGESATVEVPAQVRWNATGLYLEGGDYHFTADGEWRSSGSASGPAGETAGGLLRPRAIGMLTGTLIGWGERLFRRASRNQAADFLGARREEDLPWMSLIGVVANEVTNTTGQIVAPHERIAIGAATDARVAGAGYLYAFANDAWGFYRNNRGTVRLSVTKTAGSTERP